jgi:uncharacterized glyoxalase superfamily protein PhnB
VRRADVDFRPAAPGSQVTMPMAALWAQTFAMLTDRFGVNWAVNRAPIGFK